MQALALLTQGQQKAGLAVGTVASLILLISDIKRAFDVGEYQIRVLRSLGTAESTCAAHARLPEQPLDKWTAVQQRLFVQIGVASKRLYRSV